ncbi:DUF7147 family protein [Salirhabdus sp. Marseille-P4669]|uniref:DUF7147 family protein n=1 Tax=Salirhabdus sp. Marseille-P4669 TaxID=2042310 RepID=UPI002795FDCA|nr:methylthioribose kinase [Salirhabdus sp. Marseille-P4669]
MMLQKFIPLGNGYTDVYELLTLGKQMNDRVQHFLIFHTLKNTEPKSSLALIMKPTEVGDFQPIYICLEGIDTPNEKKESKRIQLFKQLADKQNKTPIELEVQPSSHFRDQELYFQHLIGILRANHYLKPLTLRF